MSFYTQRLRLAHPTLAGPEDAEPVALTVAQAIRLYGQNGKCPGSKVPLFVLVRATAHIFTVSGQSHDNPLARAL